MEVVESVFVEIAMDGYCHIVANAEHSAESIGAQTHVPVLAHILEALAFLLHRVVARTQSVDYYFLALNFRRLTLALALYQNSRHANTSTRRDALQLLGIH